ncbi:hypothetical protein QBC32DRAFT_369800 [Pseudoneurospora amorphoporcata]|uniref:UBA domain-containing protein n=1 Tax=Pseudoneurospora amorphoporcata TaxID=241081 RepID=A0AAN6NY05_9PEZI|nr:hypothetical protein QBC32DRAFT_369800 [Pseudoneurospora amorphoporcata]
MDDYQEKIQTVRAITNYDHEPSIAAALRAKEGDLEAVINMILDDSDKFERTYAWDETVFSANREGDGVTAVYEPNQSFHIQPPDNNPVLYGYDPGYGSTAPSRPPSRVDNRSPIGRAVDMTTGPYASGVPTNQQEEDAQLQQALAASMNPSGMHTPQPISNGLSLPPQLPPPPPPQESGVTSNGGYFGPANRSDYDPNQWAMVPLRLRQTDPRPINRTRAPGSPAFLRNRSENTTIRHRVGGILTILHSIPAARNALLQLGTAPEYGYGSNREWWKGQKILPPELQACNEQIGSEQEQLLPPWSDELHRLVAFLDSTERAYGTADILANCKAPGVDDRWDCEREFFDSHMEMLKAKNDGSWDDLTMCVKRSQYGSAQGFSEYLDLLYCEGLDLTTTNLYACLDKAFWMDRNTSGESLEGTPYTMISKLPEVLTITLRAPQGLPTAIDIPERIYLDRYLASNEKKINELQADLSKLAYALRKCIEEEERLTCWIEKETGRTMDRRTMIADSIERCKDHIQQVKGRAAWRDFQESSSDVSGEGDGYRLYLAGAEKEASVSPEEATIIAYYERKIKSLTEQAARLEKIVQGTIAPQRERIEDALNQHSKALTVPASDSSWVPTAKFTLRGVTSEPNTVFLRRQEVELIDLEDGEIPTEQWFKISCSSGSNYALQIEQTTHEAAITQACAVGTEPLLIYASDKAMNAERIPLNDALKAFIRFDNKFFSQELAQAEHEQHEDSRKRGPISMSSPDSKRRNRSNSLDSMATNHASAGDVEMDDEMRAEFLKSSNGLGYENGMEKVSTSSDHDMVDGIPPPVCREDARVLHANDVVDLLTPPYEEKVESKEQESSNIGASVDGTSERMGRVSLDEDKMDVGWGQTEVDTKAVSSQASGSSAHTEDSGITVKPTTPADDGTTTARSPEMQERSNNPFLAKAPNTAAASTTSDSTPQPYSRAIMDF